MRTGHHLEHTDGARDRFVRPLTRLAEKIYMMLYEEETQGLDGPEKISTSIKG